MHAGPATGASTAALEQCLDALHTTAAVPDSDLARLHDLKASLHCLAEQLPALMQVLLSCRACSTLGHEMLVGWELGRKQGCRVTVDAGLLAARYAKMRFRV